MSDGPQATGAAPSGDEAETAPTVLLVDDEQLVRWSLRAGLEEFVGQVDVREAADAKEALTCLAEEPVDVVLLEPEHSEGRGLALEDALREWPDAAVIVVTHRASVESAVEAMLAGAAYYIRKPFAVEEVALCVRRVLERRRSTGSTTALSYELPDDGVVLSEFLERVERDLREWARTRAGGDGATAEALLGLATGGIEASAAPTDAEGRRSKARPKASQEASPKEATPQVASPQEASPQEASPQEARERPPRSSGARGPGEGTGTAGTAPEVALEGEAQAAWERVVSVSPGLRLLKRLLLEAVVQDVAPTVLLEGEAGTGKTLLARTLHQVGRRGDQPLVEIDCSGRLEAELEEELFGRGDGADGALARVQRGTVLLEEVGALTPRLQDGLSAFLEGPSWRQPSWVDGGYKVHLIATTRRVLLEDKRAGRFERSLFGRLAARVFRIPPLRERPEDVPPLAAVFVERFSRELGERVRGISPAALELLVRRPWTGNVRELEAAIERAVRHADGATLDGEDFYFLRGESEPEVQRFLPSEGLDFPAVERALLAEALKRARGVRARAASLLGLTPGQLRYRVEKYGLKAIQEARSIFRLAPMGSDLLGLERTLVEEALERTGKDRERAAALLHLTPARVSQVLRR